MTKKKLSVKLLTLLMLLSMLMQVIPAYVVIIFANILLNIDI